jgi:tetratricopeptide (TPR) repeat protein
MLCPECNAVLPDNARFCNVCGAAMSQRLACSACGQPLQPGQKFCIHCGAAAAAAPPARQPASPTDAAPAPAWPQAVPTEVAPAPAWPPAVPTEMAPPARQRSRPWWQLAVVLLIAAVAVGIAVGVPGGAAEKLALFNRIAGRAPDAGAATTSESETRADPEALWAQAQGHQAAGAWQDAVAAVAQLRAADAGFRTAEVSELQADACAHLARQAERTPDPGAALVYWNCVLRERPDDAEAATGRLNADLYLQGQTAMAAGQYPQAIAAWDGVHRNAADYADAADRLYLAYVAYGDTLCATREAANIEEGRNQYGLARALAPARPEAAEKLLACQASTPTPTPLPGPLLGVITDGVANLRVRGGPSSGYLVLGKVSAGNTVTITGRTEDAAWVQVEAAPEHTGWISSEYVKFNYPVQAAPVASAPPLASRLPVAEAGADFSAQQGFRDWFYLISTAPGSLKFIRMPWDGAGAYRWCCDKTYSPEMRISAVGASPSQGYDVARLWVSPYDGQLRISGVARKSPDGGAGGNGVQARIVRNKDVLWEQTLGGSDMTGAVFDLTAESKSGDEFYFIVGALDDDAADGTAFTPAIELLNPDGADLPAPERWVEVVPTPVVVPPTATPTRAPAPVLCFEPRVRHLEEHKGCCAEVAGLVYNRQGKLFAPRGAAVRIEGPPVGDRYVREFGVDAGGGYSITALSVDKYTIWLKGPNIRSKKYEVQYDDLAKIRILVDFYQVACS